MDYLIRKYFFKSNQESKEKPLFNPNYEYNQPIILVVRIKIKSWFIIYLYSHFNTIKGKLKKNTLGHLLCFRKGLTATGIEGTLTETQCY